MILSTNLNLQVKQVLGYIFDTLPRTFGQARRARRYESLEDEGRSCDLYRAFAARVLSRE